MGYLGAEGVMKVRHVNWATAISICLGAAILHFGAEVFLPLAIATLIAFALSPLVSALRRRGTPRILSVLTGVTVAFLFLGAVLAVMASQISLVVESLPAYQSNIIAKLDAWTPEDGSSSVLGRFVDMMSRINTEISGALSTDQSSARQGTATGEPVAVAVVENQNIWTMLQDVLFPIISPIVTTGLIVVVVIFMLLEREELRDRFIRLTGANDLHRTTEMLEDAGSRVASYLLTQILVNVIYAVPIGVGLWIIGVPNPTLWALLTLVMRFVPYIGSVVAAALPLFLAFAASADWSMVLWTAALFVSVELVTSNIIEPRLYGSRTGLSPLAVIISAIVWTWIWGPMGLIMSTPMTVVLVVLGRYLPQFEVFDILFGNEPVLSAHSRLYQRLLAGDTVESVTRAEEALETDFLADYYQSVGIPALLLAQSDYDRGVLSQTQEEGIARSARRFVQALEPSVAEERAESDLAQAQDEPVRIIVAGGRSNLDDVAAQMLGHALSAEGAGVTALARAELMSLTVLSGEMPKPKCLVLSFLDPNPSRASLLIVRRIKRAVPGLRVGAVIWEMPGSLQKGSGLSHPSRCTASVAMRELDEIGADFVATTMDEAMTMAIADEIPKSLPEPKRRPPRRLARPKLEAAAG
jgi:predicted PurR-regulated permease PerM